MSKSYFIYGIIVPYDWYLEWEKTTGDKFIDVFNTYMIETAFSDTPNKDGIYCTFNERNKNNFIIGKMIPAKVNPNTYRVKVPKISDMEKHEVLDLVYKHFRLKGEFNLYYIVNEK